MTLIVVLAAPLLAFVLTAFLRRDPRPKPLFRLFRNTATGWGTVFIACVGVVTGVSALIYWLGECVGGLKGPARCTHLTEAWGDTLFGLSFVGQLYLAFLCLPALGLLLIAEWVTRQRLSA